MMIPILLILHSSIFHIEICFWKVEKIPRFREKLIWIKHFGVFTNQIPGDIPNWIWRLGIFFQLNISCNSLVTLEGHFLNLTSKLLVLDLYSNQLQGRITIAQSCAFYLYYSKNNFNFNIQLDIDDFLTRTKFFSLSSWHQDHCAIRHLFIFFICPAILWVTWFLNAYMQWVIL